MSKLRDAVSDYYTKSFAIISRQRDLLVEEKQHNQVPQFQPYIDNILYRNMNIQL